MLHRSLFRRSLAAGAFRRSRPLLFADDAVSEGFEKYCEMDNATLGRVQPLRNDTDEWIATEKVHGANFGIYVMSRGQSIKFAKRTNFLGDQESFFGYQALIPEMKQHALAVRELIVKQLGKEVDSVIINGELFGGKYLHPQVKRSQQHFQSRGVVRGVSSVQKENFPQYTPNLAFYAFDIKYRTQPDLPPVTMTFDEANAVFEKVPGLLFQRALIRGPLDKILAFNVETFITTVPGLLGGPMAEAYLRNNWAEGIVARHAKRGTAEMEGKTTIIKIKCTAFQELKKDRNSTKALADPMADARAMAIERVGPQLPDIAAMFPTKAMADACQHLCDHVCDSRLANVVSKLGPEALSKMSADRLAMLLAQDCVKDFIKDGTKENANLPILHRREFARYVLTESKRFVTKRWTKILEDAKADVSTS